MQQISKEGEMKREGGKRKKKEKKKEKKRYHFRVTWPFWTRLVLKPMVGMELQPS